MEKATDKLPTDAPIHRPFAQTYLHGTKADLQLGDML